MEDQKVLKSIYIKPSTWDLAKEKADEDNRSVSNYIESLILRTK